MIGIYCIKNQKTNWNYIGSSVSIFNRWKQHSKELTEGKHHCHRLQCAWDSDGATNFNFSILELCGEEELLQKEQEWVDKLYNNGYIYNTKVKIIEDNKRSNTVAKKEKIHTIKIPKNIILKGVSLRTGRILLYSLNQMVEEKSNYVEISIKNFIKELGIKSSRIYGECESIYIRELMEIKVGEDNLIYECEYENGIFTINFNENIKILKNGYYKTRIKYIDLMNISSLKFIDFLFLILNNNNELKIGVEELKNYFGFYNQYELYGDLKKKFIKMIQNDFEKVGYCLNINENRKNRFVNTIDFILK